MAKKPKKPSKRKRKGQPWPRNRRKDDKGVHLTDDFPHWALLPSDFAIAMQQPPGTPTEATGRMDPERPTTVIPELRVMPLSPFAYQTVGEAIRASDQVQIKKLNPKGGANLRYRIELAAGVSRVCDGSCL